MGYNDDYFLVPIELVDYFCQTIFRVSKSRYYKLSPELCRKLKNISRNRALIYDLLYFISYQLSIKELNSKKENVINHLKYFHKQHYKVETKLTEFAPNYYSISNYINFVDLILFIVKNNLQNTQIEVIMRKFYSRQAKIDILHSLVRETQDNEIRSLLELFFDMYWDGRGNNRIPPYEDDLVEWMHEYDKEDILEFLGFICTNNLYGYDFSYILTFWKLQTGK
jgi:hypothetical protein